jgi:hypothetical protein
MASAPTSDRRKRVFSNRTLTFGDLRAIHAQFATTRREVAIAANDSNLFDIEQLPALAAEEVFVRRIGLTVIGDDDESMQFVYEPGFIEIECGIDPIFRRPFAVICALLDAKPQNGERQCGLDLAATAAPALPRVDLPEEATTRVFRRKDRDAAEATTERTPARSATDDKLAAAQARMAAAEARVAAKRADRTAGKTGGLLPAASATGGATALSEATPIPGSAATVDPGKAAPPSHGLVSLLRRLWGGG